MAGSWKPLKNQPSFGASTMLLLTDGRVMCQASNSKNWYALRPDQFGDYVNGTWATLSPMADARLYYASAVLSDGRVMVAGGEYSGTNTPVDLNKAEIYEPILDTWASLPVPAGWTQIGDAPCCVLPSGQFLLGSIGTTKTAVYDPVGGTWKAAADKDDRSSEETWTLLPDETVLTVECNNRTRAEKYLAAGDKWVSAGSTGADLVQASSAEIGPALLMPDGRVFAIGATGHTALYTPPAQANQPGTWTAGPDFPDDGTGHPLQAKDAPGSLLPNGSVLCAVGPASDSDYPGPTSFFEFDGTALTAVPAPPNNGGPPFTGRMMLLPTGQVLFAAGTSQIHVYTPDGSPAEDWRPEITSCPTYLKVKQTYTLHGRLLNGLSQAVSYGDDATSATNYPLVRIRNLSSGRVWYCRTGDHSTMGVATGLSIQSTTFKVPVGADHGRAELQVIANGIASRPVHVTIGPFQLRFHLDDYAVKHLVGNFADGKLWALGRNGPVPVGPGDPELEKQTQAAYASIKEAVASLERIGRGIEEKRESEVPEAAPIQASGARVRQVKA